MCKFSGCKDAVTPKAQRHYEDRGNWLRNKSIAVDLEESANDQAVEAMTALLMDEEGMAAMNDYQKTKDPKNKKGKAVYDKFQGLKKHMNPVVKERLRILFMEKIKMQFRKDARVAEKFVKDSLNHLFPTMLDDYFSSHDYNKGKRPER